MVSSNDETAINLYVSRKSREVADMAISALRQHKVGPSIENCRIRISTKDRLIVWNLNKILRVIATHNSGIFDQRLADPFYERIKISILLRQHLDIISIYLRNVGEDTRQQLLQELSLAQNLTIKIARNEIWKPQPNSDSSSN
jgi:hypothetical protein